MERIQISEMTPHLLRERLAAAPVAYLPVGTIEERCEHLPLGASGFYAKGLLSALAREVGGVVLPTIPLSPKEEEDCSPAEDTGNLFVTSEMAFIEVMKGISRNLLKLGVRVLVIQASPSTLDIIERRRPRWEKESGLRILLVRPLEEETDDSGNSHAVGMDTCLMMAVCPELVELKYLSADRQTWPQGLHGPDPRSMAYAERGERCLDKQVHSMATTLRQCLQVLAS